MGVFKMKYLTDFLFLTAILCVNFLIFALAENAAVLDHSTDRYSYYDAEQSGSNLDVYDLETDQYRDFDIDSSGNIYYWNENKF